MARPPAGGFKAVAGVNDVIAPALIDKDPTEQSAIDKLLCELDGTPNKSKLGANATLAVSLAVARAGAAERGLALYRYIGALAGNTTFVMPVPAFNVINGGKHAGARWSASAVSFSFFSLSLLLLFPLAVVDLIERRAGWRAENLLPFQEFMIMPTGAESFTEAMQIGTEVYTSLRSIVASKYGKTAVHVGDEGGFAPNVSDARLVAAHQTGCNQHTHMGYGL